MSENKIYITDDEGKEIEMNIYFTFGMEDKNYVVLYETGKEDDLYPFTYDDEGHIYAVEDEETLAMIEEVVSAFEEENL